VSPHPNRSIGSRSASRQFIPDAGRQAPHLAGCHLAAPPQSTTPAYRSGLRPTRVAAWPIRCPACRPWGASRASPAPGLRCRRLTSAGRSGRMAPPSVLPGHPADLPWSAVRPSVHRRRLYKAQSLCGWRTSRSRARSSRRSHTSYPVRVPRPAPSFHASFRPHLTVTPVRFPCPSAPRTPEQGTFTPEHDRMHGTHAGTGTRSRQGRRADRPCWDRDRAAVVAGEVTITPGDGSRRGRAKGLSRPREDTSPRAALGGQS
jgi:hypothetical protein